MINKSKFNNPLYGIWRAGETFILCATFLLLLPSIISAQCDNQEFVNGTDADYLICCENLATGVLCDSTVNCNVTAAHYPNGSLLAANVSATFRTDGIWNYSFGNLDVLGVYDIAGFCIGMGYQDSDTDTFEVVTSVEETTTHGIASLLALFAVPAMMVVFGINFRKRHLPLTFLFSIATFWFILLGINLASGIASSETDASSIIPNINILYIIFVWIMIFFVGYMLIYFIYQFSQKKQDFNSSDDIESQEG